MVRLLFVCREELRGPGRRDEEAAVEGQEMTETIRDAHRCVMTVSFVVDSGYSGASASRGEKLLQRSASVWGGRKAGEDPVVRPQASQCTLASVKNTSDVIGMSRISARRNLPAPDSPLRPEEG